MPQLQIPHTSCIPDVSIPQTLAQAASAVHLFCVRPTGECDHRSVRVSQQVRLAFLQRRHLKAVQRSCPCSYCHVPASHSQTFIRPCDGIQLLESDAEEAQSRYIERHGLRPPSDGLETPRCVLFALASSAYGTAQKFALNK